MLPFMGGYLTKDGELNLIRLDVFLHELSKVELVFLKEQHKNNSRNEKFKKDNKTMGQRLF